MQPKTDNSNPKYRYTYYGINPACVFNSLPYYRLPAAPLFGIECYFNAAVVHLAWSV